MIESPVLIELLNECERDVLHRVILRVLTRQFGTVPETVAIHLRTVQELERQRELLGETAVCTDVDAFWKRLES